MRRYDGNQSDVDMSDGGISSTNRMWPQLLLKRREGSRSLKCYSRNDFLMPESKNINESDESLGEVAESKWHQDEVASAVSEVDQWNDRAK